MDNRTLPIAQAAAGDQEAFALLVHRMTPLIHSQIHSFRCDGVEDEDLVQEALMGLLAAVRTYREGGGATFTTYATACIRHRLLSVARRYGPVADREVPMENSPELPDITADPALRLQEQEDLGGLLERLRTRLTEREYRVLLLRLGDCSYAEIAARLGITPKAVDNAIQRIRRKLI
ncbi:MAG: sigma-70 family RNA polymerase sigma factor [Clostridia bacterium]|nr:sigma-70 family RNA polymerase sigma factor [Clostridia bacterium]